MNGMGKRDRILTRDEQIAGGHDDQTRCAACGSAHHDTDRCQADALTLIDVPPDTGQLTLDLDR